MKQRVRKCGHAEAQAACFDTLNDSGLGRSKSRPRKPLAPPDQALRQIGEIFFSLFGYDRVFPLLTLEGLDDPYDPKDHSTEPDDEP